MRQAQRRSCSIASGIGAMSAMACRRMSAALRHILSRLPCRTGRTNRLVLLRVGSDQRLRARTTEAMAVLVTSPSDHSLLFPWLVDLFLYLRGLLWRSPTDCSWHKLSTRARYAAYHYSLIRNLLQRGESAHVFTAAAWGPLVDDRALREHCSKRAQQILRSSACPLVVCGNVYTSVIIPSLVPCSGFCSAFYFIRFLGIMGVWVSEWAGVHIHIHVELVRVRHKNKKYHEI